jgi:hypothetical protein
VPVTDHLGPDGEPDGTLIAELRLDGVRVEAHLCHPDQTVSGAKSRAAAHGIHPVPATGSGAAA